MPFCKTVFQNKGPAQLASGDWLCDTNFVSLVRRSWIDQYADYMGSPAAEKHVDDLENNGRLFDHYAPYTLHAIIEENIVGVGAARPLEGINLITMLEVHPEYRSRGIGGQLLAALETVGAASMAHVSVHQPRVKSFYLRQGFHLLQPAKVQHGNYLLDFHVVAKKRPLEVFR